jgi:hypothetical protein
MQSLLPTHVYCGRTNCIGLTASVKPHVALEVGIILVMALLLCVILLRAWR